MACSTSASAISPCAAATGTQANRTVNYPFILQNKNLFEPVPYVMTYARAGQVTSCTPPGVVTVQANSSKSFTVTYVSAATPRTGSFTLTADDGLAAVAATITVTVNAIPQTLLFVASVAPHLQLHESDSGAVDRARVTLRNAGADAST